MSVRGTLRRYGFRTATIASRPSDHPQAHEDRERERGGGEACGEAARHEAELDDVLASLGRFTTDALAADRVMRLERSELDGRSIADSLDDPRRSPTAWSILASLGA